MATRLAMVPMPAPTARGIDCITVDRVNALGGADLVEARFQTKATPPHSHPEVEIGVIVSGRRLVHCRGRTYRAGAGSVVVFNPGEIHAGAPVDDQGSSYRAFLIPASTLGQTTEWHAECRAPSAECRALPWFEHPVVADPVLARDLVNAHIAIATGGAAEVGDRQLIAALTAFARRHRRPMPPPATGTHTEAAVRRVRAYLEDNYFSKVNLGTLAVIAGLSVYHLIRVFRAATGLPPYSYLEQVRINRAAVLLREGRPVSEVAFLTGFADQSHLTRFFKRLVGVPPGRYQRSALLAQSARGLE